MFLMSKSEYQLVNNKDPEGNFVLCSYLNITRPMSPYTIYNPLTKTFIFVPGSDIFNHESKYTTTVNYLVFYDIFDGFFHVPLKFILTVIRPEGIRPAQLKFLKVENNNTAPTFVFGVNIPILHFPKLTYMADKPMARRDVKVWDYEKNGISLTHNLVSTNAS